MSYRPIPYPLSDGGTGGTSQSTAQTSLGVPASTSVMLLSGSQAMTGAMSLGTFQINNLATPTHATDAVTKAYVDALAFGITTTSARLATTGTSYTLATATPNTLDGVSLNVNDVILVKDQATQSQNGIYTVTTVGSGANGTWTRSANYNSSADFTNSIIVFVSEGTVYGATEWMLPIDPDTPPTLGTTALVWVQIQSAGALIFSSGLNKTGNTVTAVGDGTTISVSSTISIYSGYVGQTSITTLGTVSSGTWAGTAVAVAHGGTGATSAGSARTNLSAAPNTASYWLGTSNGELSSGIVPSQGTGILLSATAGTVAVDTTVVWTTTNSVSATNKTLTSPVITTPQYSHAVKAKTATYTLLATDDIVTFNISGGANAVLPASSGVTTGQIFTVKNKAASSATVTVLTSGSDTGENGTITNSVGLLLAPKSLSEFFWDGSEWCVA